MLLINYLCICFSFTFTITPIAQYLPWTFYERSHGMFGRFHSNVQGTFLELRKCPGFLNVPKQCSCGTFQERSKGILRGRSAAIFREYPKGTFREHFYRTFAELFAGTFREHSQITFWNIPREHLGNIFWEFSCNYLLQHSGNFPYR